MAIQEIIKLRSKKYGVVSTMIDSIDLKLDNGYIVLTEKNNKILTGFIDQNYKLVIDFDTMAYSYHYINDNDILISFKYSNGNDIYYHLRKYKESYKIINKTNPNIKTQIETYESCPKYWSVRTIDKRFEYSIYSVEDGCEVVDGLSNLIIIKDNDKHRFSYEKVLYSRDVNTEKDEEITTIAGYLDENCHFSSDILDLGSDGETYNGLKCNNFHSQYFDRICAVIIEKHAEKKLERQKMNLLILRDMYHNPIESKDCIMYDFNSRRKV